eukprot:ANDGO_03262.mRNA.1 hypothetical protein
MTWLSPGLSSQLNNRSVFTVIVALLVLTFFFSSSFSSFLNPSSSASSASSSSFGSSSKSSCVEYRFETVSQNGNTNNNNNNDNNNNNNDNNNNNQYNDKKEKNEKQSPGSSPPSTSRSSSHEDHHHLLSYFISEKDKSVSFVNSLFANAKKKPKVWVQLVGGMGNKLFLLATAYATARKNGLPAPVAYLKDSKDFNDWGGHPLSTRDPFLPRSFPELYPAISVIRSNNDPPARYFSGPNYSPFFPVPSFDANEDAIGFTGYWFSERYFSEYKSELLLHYFRPAPTILEYIEKHYWGMFTRPTIGVHMRVGHAEDNFGPAAMNENFLKNVLRKFGNEFVTVWFTDNVGKITPLMESVQREFPERQYYLISDAMYVELHLMAKCTHFVISDSTFSWWGAWLGTNADRQVFYEKRFERPGSDSIPASWTALT